MDLRRRGCRSGFGPGAGPGGSQRPRGAESRTASRKQAPPRQTSPSSAATIVTSQRRPRRGSRAPAVRFVSPLATSAQALREPLELVLALDHRVEFAGERGGTSPTTRNDGRGVGDSLQPFWGSQDAPVRSSPLTSCLTSSETTTAPVGEGLEPGADVRGEAVDVLLVEIEVDGPVMDPRREGRATLRAAGDGSSCTACASASPARTARSASFSCAAGKPKIDSVPSPLIRTMWPSKRFSITSRLASR